ncbi:MAG: hypothetical protein ABJA93_11350 [Sporichthyaceae bacterium]
MTDDGDPAVSVEDQFAAIGSLGQVLDDVDVEYWLFGGWAVDFWVGAVTRPHGDIDVAAWRADFDVIRSALVAAGWVHTPAKEDVVGTRYRMRTAELEFTFVESGEGGEVVVPLPTGSVVWSHRLRLETSACRFAASALGSSRSPS